MRILRRLFAPFALVLLVSGTAAAQAPALNTRVWVNTSSGVYHCPDSRYYGATKAGEYMTEAQARGSGHRANGGKACSGSAATTAAPQPLAAPGGEKRVWVNTASGVFHCPGTTYYGKTKRGTYMIESAAIEAGHRPAGGSRCQ